MLYERLRENDDAKSVLCRVARRSKLGMQFRDSFGRGDKLYAPVLSAENQCEDSSDKARTRSSPAANRNDKETEDASGEEREGKGVARLCREASGLYMIVGFLSRFRHSSVTIGRLCPWLSSGPCSLCQAWA